jgi:twitching motility two-component system response regulator PilH
VTEPRTILVVDDSPTELLLARRAVERLGHRAVAAADGEEALRRAVADRPDVVLLDVILPKRNGFQVCRLLKTAPETQAIKVILLTAKSQDTDRFWGLQQGADWYLTKPLAASDLAAALAELLNPAGRP